MPLDLRTVVEDKKKDEVVDKQMSEFLNDEKFKKGFGKLIEEFYNNQK